MCPIASARSRSGASARPWGPFCPIRPNVVWALDFQFDQTSDGRMLKILNVIDEFTREALATDVERSIDADGVVACLERLAAERGAPAYVRFDHGPEFIAYAVADWCRFNGLYTLKSGARVLIRGGDGRLGQWTPPAWSRTRSL